jgi:hypothetical protein
MLMTLILWMLVTLFLDDDDSDSMDAGDSISGCWYCTCDPRATRTMADSGSAPVAATAFPSLRRSYRCAPRNHASSQRKRAPGAKKIPKINRRGDACLPGMSVKALPSQIHSRHPQSTPTQRGPHPATGYEHRSQRLHSQPQLSLRKRKRGIGRRRQQQREEESHQGWPSAALPLCCAIGLLLPLPLHFRCCCRQPLPDSSPSCSSRMLRRPYQARDGTVGTSWSARAMFQGIRCA